MSTGRPCYVYRVFDAAGALMYIGASHNVEMRLQVHAMTNRFGGTYARHESTEYPDRETALAAESAAIVAEAPLLNVQHNTGRPIDHSIAESVRAALGTHQVQRLSGVLRIPSGAAAKKLRGRVPFTTPELHAIATALGTTMSALAAEAEAAA